MTVGSAAAAAYIVAALLFILSLAGLSRHESAKAGNTFGIAGMALALAATIAANGPLAVAATKEIARRSSDWTLDEGWQRQDELVAPVFGSEDAREGATAFAEKRPPVWKGR